MAKSSARYVCQSCGANFSRWMGKCEACNAWNSIVEETVREGFHRGFEMVVAVDGVSSFDDELHRATLRNLGHKFALLTDTASLMTTLTGTP